MSKFFINGAKYAVATQLGAAAAITAITNATDAVATSATLPTNGDIVLIKSGWASLTDTVARVSGATGSTFTLEDVDTSDTVDYPAGEGIGAYQKATGFVSFNNVRDIQTNGGEQQFFNYQNVEDKSSRQRQDPTYKNPMSLTFQLLADSTQAWWDALVQLDKKREPTVLREILPGGDVIYYYGIVSFNKIPTRNLNEHQLVEATFSLYGDPIRYAGV